MKALILDAPRRMQIGDWPAPECGPGDVEVRPLAIGICAGDQYLYAGRNPYARYPLVGGHEICGIVTRIGPEVSRCQVGDRVVIEPVVGCGHCYPCRHGKPNCCVNFCLIGLHRAGGFAESCVAPQKNIHVVPAGLEPLIASFAEPLTIGLHACRRGQLEGGEFCLVLGAGPIGLAIVEVAKLRGARVTVTDLNPSRLDFAGTLGVETLPADGTLLDQVRARTNGDGADLVIEATGSEAAIQSTMELAAPGARVVIVGLVKEGVGISLPGLEFTRREVNLLGSRNSVNCFPEALALLASGAIHYPRVAERIPLWEAVPVFARLDENPAALHKGVLMAE